MRVWNKLVCAVRGHYPFADVRVEPPPPAPPVKIGGTGLNIINAGNGMIGGQHTISVSNSVHNPLSAMEDYFVAKGATEATLHISANALRSRLSMCARCHGMYWITEPNLAAVVDSNNVPELKAYRVWKQRELYEAKQRETNEAAARLYKQYQMVLKLAAPRCDDPEDGQA
jgi:cytochrome c553